MLNKTIKKNSGASLVEILITTSIFAIISSIAILNLVSFRNERVFDTDADLIVDTLQNVQNRAILGERGESWGARFTNNESGKDSVEIFYGSSYSTSTVVTTQLLSGYSNFTNPASGTYKDITYTPLTGVPTVSDVVTLKKTNGNKVHIITVNSIGRVSNVSESYLSGFWSFDEGSVTTAYDSSSNSNDGTMYSLSTPTDLTTISGCKTYRCISLDGVDDYVEISNSSTLPALNEDITIIAWIKTLSDGIVLERGDNTSGYQIRISGGSPYFYVRADAATIYSVNSPASVNDNSWHFLSAKITPTAAYLTVDSSTASSTSGYILSEPSESMQIGRATGNFVTGSDNPFTGSIDDVRIYNRELSSSEINEIYENY